MQNLLPTALAAFTVLAAGAAMAQPPGGVDFSAHASLPTPLSSPREAIINGVRWRCEGTECRGVAERKANADSIIRECRRVVEVVGPISTYWNWSRGRVLTESQIRACNRGSEVQTAQK